MSDRSSVSPLYVGPAELAQMLACAGLVLDVGQTADLALGWRQLVDLLVRIPRDRPLVDDQASVFRLPPLLPARPRS
jgi:hypothetical protein